MITTCIIAGLCALVIIAFFEGKALGNKRGWQESSRIYQRILDESRAIEGVKNQECPKKNRKHVAVSYLRRVK